jgi:putative dimethyl sulfoxide reductase chaperone
MITDDNSDRAEAYRVLVDIFSKPSSDNFLEAIKEDFELESKEPGDEIRRDFHFLFVSPVGGLPPRESLYVSGESAPAAAVSEFYEKAGLTMDEEFEYIPDHISLEFLFMSYLIDTRDLDLQENFLVEHIINWIPYYCEQVIKKAGTFFYREIAEITKDFVVDEFENFG